MLCEECPLRSTHDGALEDSVRLVASELTASDDSLIGH